MVTADETRALEAVRRDGTTSAYVRRLPSGAYRVIARRGSFVREVSTQTQAVEALVEGVGASQDPLLVRYDGVGADDARRFSDAARARLGFHRQRLRGIGGDNVPSVPTVSAREATVSEVRRSSDLLEYRIDRLAAANGEIHALNAVVVPTAAGRPLLGRMAEFLPTRLQAFVRRYLGYTHVDVVASAVETEVRAAADETGMPIERVELDIETRAGRLHITIDLRRDDRRRA